MQKPKAIVIAVILVSFLFSFISLTSAAEKETKPLKFGLVYSTSGALGFLGNNVITGHKMAIDEITKAGGFQGRQVEIILRDDAGSPELTTRYMKELVLRESVDWILTGTGSAISLAAAAVAKEFKVPTFIMGGGTEKVTVEEWNPYIFRYRPTSGTEARTAAKVLADEVLKDIKDPKIYWITWDYEYGRSVHEPFIAKIKELRPDVKIVGEAWPRVGETDYGPFIVQMLALRPHVVINSIWGGGVVALLKQGKSHGLWDITKLMSMAEFAGFEYRKPIGFEIPEGTWSSAYDDPGWPNNEGQRKFYDLYYNFTGKPKDEPPPTFVFPTYNMVHFINKAMEKAGTTEPAAVLKAMEGLEIQTFQGPIRIREFDHQVTSAYVWGPMIKKEGLPYLIVDPKRIKYVPIDKDLYTKEEWLARRKAAGKE